MSTFAYLILNYQTYEETLECIESIQATSGESLASGRSHVVVVDNGSDHGKLEALREELPTNVHLIEAGQNLGFAKGNNLAFRYAKENWDPDFLFMMNSDMVLTEPDLEDKVDLLYGKYDFAVAGGDWRSPDGRSFNPQVTKEVSVEAIDTHIAQKERDLALCKAKVEPAVAAAKRVVKSTGIAGKNRSEQLLNRIDEEIEIRNSIGRKHIAIKCGTRSRLQLHGCMWIFSRKYTERFDGIYDRTFLYYEEDFLRLRCENAGLKMLFFPELTAIHKESATENVIYKNVVDKHQKRNENMIASLKLLREYMEDPEAAEAEAAEPEKEPEFVAGSVKTQSGKRISIAMTTYNGEKYVVEQLDSLLAQTLQADEIIIADDRSPDNTYAILEQYVADHPEAPITIYKNEENLGFKKNFHEVLKKVTGDYIFLCDQDDNWYPDKLETCVRVMEENPAIRTLNTSFVFMDGEGEPIETVLCKGRANNNIFKSNIKPGELREFKTDFLVMSNISPGCTMCMIREVCEEFVEGYNYELPHDYFINLVASLKNGCYYLDVPTLKYRIHGGNTIGLDIVEKDESRPFYDMNVKGTYPERLAEAEELANTYAAVYRTGIETHISSRSAHFLEKRYDMLKERSLPKFIKLLINFKTYNSIFTVRRILGDLYYVLYMDQILKRH